MLLVQDVGQLGPDAGLGRLAVDGDGNGTVDEPQEPDQDQDAEDDEASQDAETHLSAGVHHDLGMDGGVLVNHAHGVGRRDGVLGRATVRIVPRIGTPLSVGAADMGVGWGTEVL